MTKFDFQDGNGPVPAHQHPNGGGWVADTAIVSDTARVDRNALVFDNAWVSDDVRVYGNARVYGDAWVYGNVRVYGDARVYGNALVSDNARVYGNARVYSNAMVSDDARVYGDALVYGDTLVSDNANVSRSPIVITGFAYMVVITDNLIKVGCKNEPLDWWEMCGIFFMLKHEKESESKYNLLMGIAREHMGQIKTGE